MNILNQNEINYIFTPEQDQLVIRLKNIYLGNNCLVYRTNQVIYVFVQKNLIIVHYKLQKKTNLKIIMFVAIILLNNLV